jgi:uncharacterized protein (TIGR02246 family)
MYPIVTAFFCLSVFSLAAFQVPENSAGPNASAEIDPSVVKGANNYLKAVLAGDPSAVAAVYREDAVLMPADRPLLRGCAAIENYYRECFKSPAKITIFTFTHLESPTVGDTAYDVGTYKQTLSMGSGVTLNDTGKYSVILKRSGGEWKIAYLIYNSDFPPKAPPSASGNR